MRWERLFEDLEAQLLEEERRERRLEVADRTRRERATISLLDRMAGGSTRVEVQLVSGRRVTGDVRQVGADWFALAGEDRRAWLIPGQAVVHVTPQEGAAEGGLRAPRRAGGDAAGDDRWGPAVRRLGLGYPLRALARGRTVVAIEDTLGHTWSGTIDGVGADYVELSQHLPDLPRRPDNVTARRWFATSSIAAVAAVSAPGDAFD